MVLLSPPRPVLLLAGSAIASLAACGGGDAQDSEAAADSGQSGDTGADCDTDYELSWSAFGDPFFHTWCRSCHSAEAPQRFGAPEGVDFDTEAEVIDQSVLIRAWTIDMEAMPLGGGISEEELLLLDQYLRCGL